MKDAKRKSARDKEERDDAKAKDDKRPAPKRPKPGPEGRDNLRKRAEWFEQRTSKAGKD